MDVFKKQFLAGDAVRAVLCKYVVSIQKSNPLVEPFGTDPPDNVIHPRIGAKAKRIVVARQDKVTKRSCKIAGVPECPRLPKLQLRPLVVNFGRLAVSRQSLRDISRLICLEASLVRAIPLRFLNGSKIRAIAAKRTARNLSNYWRRC